MRKLILAVFLLAAIPAWAAKKPVITTTSCPQGQTTIAYVGCTINGKWGVKPYTFSLVAPLNVLPVGLSLATANSIGSITGTPTVVGTTQIKVRLTDSSGPPKTFDQTLYISIIATPVPPANPVIITTATPLPAGLVGSAYSTTVVASGGSGTFVYTVPVGALPPGLVINSSTGAITGTPTAPGISSFAVRATDSVCTTCYAQQNYYISIINPTPSPTYLFTTAMADLAAWDFVNVAGNPVVTSCPGGGNCTQIRYTICGDPNNASCGPPHQDANRWVSKIMTTGLTDAFIRGYVYFKSPESGAVAQPLQRKIFWISDSLSAGNSNGTWSHGLTSDSTASGIALRTFANGSCGNSTTGTTAASFLSYDTFYSIELESKLNTPGSSDGFYKVWVNGSLVINQTGANQRGTCTTDAHFFSVGRQTDRNNYLAVDEYRYWKNVIINNTGPIGP